MKLFSTEVADEVVVGQDNQNFAAAVDAVCHVLDDRQSQLKVSGVNAVGYGVLFENGDQIFIDPGHIFGAIADEKLIALNSYFKVICEANKQKTIVYCLLYIISVFFFNKSSFFPRHTDCIFPLLALPTYIYAPVTSRIPPHDSP